MKDAEMIDDEQRRNVPIIHLGHAWNSIFWREKIDCSAMKLLASLEPVLCLYLNGKYLCVWTFRTEGEG
jgi:hypothetical protein